MHDLARSCSKQGVRLLVCGLMHQPMDIARRSGLLVLVGEDGLLANLAAGLAAAAAHLQANASYGTSALDR